MGKMQGGRLFGGRSKAPETENAPGSAQFNTQLFISGVNTPVCVQMLINKIGFVMGKADVCDGILDFNEEISREHCKIIWRDGIYYIVDLNSTNGTYLNGEALAANREYPIHPGDRLRLSASTFKVEQIYSLANE